jgi:hypothetical protein
MNQHVHTKSARRIEQIVTWLKDLTIQQKDGKPVHRIQSCTVVNCYQPHVSMGYMAIVICNHNMHEHAEEIALEMAEAGPQILRNRPLNIMGETIDEPTERATTG